MDSVQKTVLSKFVCEKEGREARAEVSPGAYPVDFAIRFHGVMNVGEDYSRAATTSIPWLEVTTLYREVFRQAIDALVAKIDAGGSVSRSDLTGMTTAGVFTTEVLVDCIRNALQNGVSAVGAVKERVEEVKAGIEALKKDLVSTSPLQKVPGKVMLNVQAEVLEIPQGMTAVEVAEAVNPRPQHEIV